uniref:Uncharacterized protein n=1 Tax=Oryza sativa subsp. japonica TaxID=39947 RepID=Q2QRR3_ORYSJ|nr:hypothetical protein LOC_Os12g26680 [Oryza sativa Japonica Group]
MDPAVGSEGQGRSWWRRCCVRAQMKALISNILRLGGGGSVGGRGARGDGDGGWDESGGGKGSRRCIHGREGHGPEGRKRGEGRELQEATVTVEWTDPVAGDEGEGLSRWRRWI